MCSGNTDILYLDTVFCLFSRQILHIPASFWWYWSVITARGGLKAPSPLSHCWHFRFSWDDILYTVIRVHHLSLSCVSRTFHTSPYISQSTSLRLSFAPDGLWPTGWRVFCLKCSWRLFGGCYGVNPPQAYVFPEGAFYRAGEGEARILRVRAYLEQVDHCERVFDRHVQPWSLPLPASCLALWDLLCHPSHSGGTKKLWNYELDKSSFL